VIVMMPFEWDVRVSSKDHAVAAFMSISTTNPATALHHYAGRNLKPAALSEDEPSGVEVSLLVGVQAARVSDAARTPAIAKEVRRIVIVVPISRSSEKEPECVASGVARPGWTGLFFRFC
uniref:hypothetical protein n=1 Tax=Marisediminicola senii TaxID=2711233 RepID=UPI001F174EEE